MSKKILLLIPFLFLGACFTATKAAFEELIIGSKSQCPIATKNFYRVLKDGTTYVGDVKFAAEKIGNTGESVCYLTAAKGMDSGLGLDIRGFVSRSFYKINPQLLIAYNRPYSDKGSLYFIQSDTKGGWIIYGSCKSGSADCPTATTKQGILDLAKELPRQKPSYVLELVK